jgi:hypothetical protein
VGLRLPVAEYLNDGFRRGRPKGTMFLTLFARRDVGRVLFGDQQLWVGSKETSGLTRGLRERTGHVLAMVDPRRCQLLMAAESEQSGKRRRVLDINASAASETPADKGRGSGHQVFDSDDEIDVVQGPRRDLAAMNAKLPIDRQTACQRTSKAMSQDRLKDLCRSTRITLVQQGREHDS